MGGASEGVGTNACANLATDCPLGRLGPSWALRSKAPPIGSIRMALIASLLSVSFAKSFLCDFSLFRFSK